MRELESKDGVYSLENWLQFQVDHSGIDGALDGSRALRVEYSAGEFKDHQGNTVTADVSMIRKPVDISEIDLD